MNRTEHLLTCLSEECNEVAQRVSKALRFGLSEIQPGQDKTNAERVVQEFIDLYAVVEMLQEAKVLTIDLTKLHHSVNDKKAKVEKFMEYARSQGALI